MSELRLSPDTSGWGVPGMLPLSDTDPSGATIYRTPSGAPWQPGQPLAQPVDPTTGTSTMPINADPSLYAPAAGAAANRHFGPARPQQALTTPAVSGATQPPQAAPPSAAGTDTGVAQPTADDPRSLIPTIREAAIANGVDPDIAVRVAQSEGLKTFSGDSGTSGGAFQLHVGGGLGDDFQRETGLDPLDPRNEKATINWAMRKVRETGWGPWHGAAGIGITGGDGITGYTGPITAGMTEAGKARFAAVNEEYNTIKQALDGILKKMNETDPSDPEYRALLRQHREYSQQLEQAYLNQAFHAPQRTQRDIMGQFGSLAMLAGVLGGFGARVPAIASLNAAGAAMEAMNANDERAYRDQMEVWKLQTGALEHAISMENNQIKDILAEKNTSLREKHEALADAFRMLGMEKQLADLRIGNYDAIIKDQERRVKMAQDLETLQKTHAQTEKIQAEKKEKELWGDLAGNDKTAREARAYIRAKAAERAAKEGKDPEFYLGQMSQDPALREEALSHAATKAGGGGLEVGKPFEIVDDQGHVVRQEQLREYRDRPGYIVAETGEPLALKLGEHVRQITPTTAGGGRAGAQVLRQLVGGREVLSDLQNVVRLPVGTTIGALGTVHPGPSITEALKGDLTRQLTDQDSQLMQASMASMERELSVLMSPVYGGNWAAQQITPLIPKSGDTLGTVLFKLSRLAQSADNALEAAEKSPILSNDEREYAADMRKQISEAIPWTPGQAMDFVYRGHPKESFGNYVKRQSIAAPQGGPSSAPAPPQPGDLIDGHVFKGGDPSDPKNWVKAPEGAVPTR